MKQFPSIEKLDIYILYTLELASSLSMLLLASMANVLTKDSVLTDNLIMQRI
jgi:hypothetical protein